MPGKASISRTAIIAIFTVVFLTAMSGRSCTRGVENTVNNATQQIVAVLDRGIAALDKNSSAWQATLISMQSQLTKDTQSTIRNELQSLLDRGIAATGEEIRCNMDFIGQRIKQALIRLRAEELGEQIPPVQPGLCSVTPDHIDVSLEPARRPLIRLSGFDFDLANITAQLIKKNNIVEDVIDYISESTKYRIIINTSLNGIALDADSIKIEIKWNGEHLTTIPMIMSSEPTPQPQPEPTPTNPPKLLNWNVSNLWGGAGYTWVGDFNNDHRTDIASANGGNIYMHLSTGSGFNNLVWAVPNQWGGAGYTWVGDFNNDGRSDIASASGGNIFMHLSTGSGFTNQTWTVPNQWGGAGYTWVGDFNNDGRSDIASANGGNIFMHLSTGSGFTNRTWTVPNQWGGAGYTWVGDFNNDGRSDIASANAGNIYMHLSTGSGFNNQIWVVPNQWGGSGYTWVADFNNDGRSDIASAIGGSIHMHISTGTNFNNTVLNSASLWGSSGYTWIGDFNNDQLADIASASGGNIYIRFYFGAGG